MHKRSGLVSAARLMTWFDGAGKIRPGILCLLGLIAIGSIDYITDYRVSIIVFYVLPIGFGTVYVTREFGAVLSVLAVVISRGGDLLSGAPFPGMGIFLWNDLILLLFFLVIVFLLDRLQSARKGLETKVMERTISLRREMEERRRLEREILDLSERERQRFGHELHDTVCQELASAVIAGRLLSRRFERADNPDGGHVRELINMIDGALSGARSIARGFFIAGFDVLGLAEALNEAARNAAKTSGVSCVVRIQEGIRISNQDVLMHFFRIAQEGIHNAVKHAGASHIVVSLTQGDNAVTLVIEDDGKGMPESTVSARGLGLRIMAYRTSVIGGTLNMERSPHGGTRAVCTVPSEEITDNIERPK